jgi:oligopeptide/dipeptide ABC transporter ATP-binding protein
MSLLLSLCDQIAIMYAGEVVEQASSQDILKRPAHPYTRGLSDAFPSLHGAVQGREIPGNPPDLARLPAGCRFHPRCAYAEAVCRQKAPPAINLGAGHTARCHLLAEEEGSHDIVFS